MRDKLEAAWKILRQEPPLSDTSGTWLRDYLPAKDRFRRLLDAEAWLDAVLMLVPAGVEFGLNWSRMNMDMGGKNWRASVSKHRASGATPAEALLSAILKAKEQDHAE